MLTQRKEEILRRIEHRQVERHPSPEMPNLAVFASVVYPHAPIISMGDIDKYMLESRVIPYRYGVEFGIKQVEGGVCYMGKHSHNCFWELNECGIIYHRKWVKPEPLTQNEDKQKELYLASRDILTQIHHLIFAAREFYRRCQYSDNVEIVAQLRQVHGQRLKFKDILNDWDREDARIRESKQSEISASIQCLPQNLQKADEYERVLFGVSDELVGSFNRQESNQQLWWEQMQEWKIAVAGVCSNE